MENKLDHEQIEQITLEIIQLKKETETNIIKIGEKLTQIKNSLPHGEFVKYLEEKIDYTRQTANKFMKIADEFTKSKATLHLGSEKLYILTTIKDKDEREQFIKDNNVEQMSTRQLKKTIKDMKNERKKVIEPPKTDNRVIEPVGDKTSTEPPISDIKGDTLEGLQQQRKNIIEKRLEFVKENTKEYQEINNKICNLKDKRGLYDQMNFMVTLNELTTNTRCFLQTNLAPFIYSRALKHLDNPVVAQNILDTIKYVDEWSKEIKDKFPIQYKKDMKFIDADIITEASTTNNNNIEDVWAKTISIVNEIWLRTGEFYNKNDLDLDEREAILITRYIAGEISHTELRQTIEANKLKIPYIFDEEEYKKYLDNFEISNSYEHYVSNYNFETKIDKSYTYYDVVLSEELSYDQVVERMYALEQGETEETRLEWIKKDEYLFKDGRYTVDMGSEDCTDYICIYKDKELLGHYDINNSHYYHDIEKLFDFYKINDKYLKLVDKFTEQLEANRLAQKKQIYNDTVRRSKFKYIEEDETYLVLQYNDATDYIVVFKGYDKVASYLFSKGTNSYSIDFYSIVLEEKYIKELIEEANKNKVDLDGIFRFHKKFLAKAKEINEEFNPFRDYKKKYSDFNWDNFDFDNFEFKKSKDVSLELFDNEELNFLKDMLKDKKLWKKFYVKTAIKVHPDRVANEDDKTKKKAENQMKLLNSINDKINKQ